MRWLRLSIPALATAGAIAAACSSDSTAPQQPVPPGGTYAIISLTQSGISLDTPLVSGTFVISGSPQNKYNVRILITVPSPDSIVDSGTYSFTPPNNVTLNSSAGGAALAGTYTYNSSSGALQVKVPSQSLTLNAQKQ